MTVRPPSFISYSANFEDVILNRLFGAQETGFFVDVGAAHPKMENDCKALYDRGWRGINIEPNPRFFAELQAQRPDDISLRVAIDETEGTRGYFWIDGSGLSTLDEGEARRCEQEGWSVECLEIETASLAHILERHAAAQIDVLKIDVEGWEEVVLRSNDWARFVPSVIMLEATLPERPQRRETGIEAYLSEKGYIRAYFDGLNDFYVHYGFVVPDGSFSLPPNVFDNFESYLLVEAREHTANLEVSLASATRYSESEEAALEEKGHELAQTQHLLKAQTERVAEIGGLQQAGLLKIMKLEAALQAALDAQSRDHHDAVRRADDITRLRASLAKQQVDLMLHAQRAQDSHVEREELLHLRALTNAQASALAMAAANAVVPLPVVAIDEAQDEPVIIDLSPYHNEIARLQAELDACIVERDHARLWFDAMRSSSSWRLTRPLRVAGRAVRTLSGGAKPPQS